MRFPAPWKWLFTAVVLSLCPMWGVASTSEDMIGCYATERNGQASFRFYLDGGAVFWTVRRRSGWQKQESVAQVVDIRRPHPDLPVETLEKVEGMLDMGDMFFLIKFKDDRIQDVTGRGDFAHGIELMKRSGSPFLISANGVGPVFRVACEEKK
ncbi:hypothetical protein [Hydrogenophaga luteola]|uniref:Uncharacterized protein n=1 Tax=Hydrogenophaga luteola TaxID=1591122 RepID=A0ABV7W3I4_9BURK